MTKSTHSAPQLVREDLDAALDAARSGRGGRLVRLVRVYRSMRRAGFHPFDAWADRQVAGVIRACVETYLRKILV